MRERVREREGVGEEGEGPGAVFSVLSHSEEPPPESRVSAELHHDLFSDFML